MAEFFQEQLKALLDELKDLPGGIERGALKVAMFEAANLLASAASQEAPVAAEATISVSQRGGFKVERAPGTLKRSFVPVKPKVRKGEVRSGVEGAYYGKWVEFGHTLKSHGKKKERQVIGHVPPNPFMQRAFEANKQWMLDLMQRTLIEELTKRIDRAKRKQVRKQIRDYAGG